jgi:anti-sigma factor RsiW
MATDAQTSAPPEIPGSRPLNAPGLFVGVAVFGALAIAVLAYTMLRTPQIPAVISLDYTRVAGSVLKADDQRSDSGALAASLSARLAGAAVRVPDLSAAGFALDGGSVRELLGRPGIVAIYHNTLQDLVVWHQFAGSVDDLPSTTDVRERQGRRYFVHRKSTNVLVFWQDGSRLDVLTSSLPAEQVVALAFQAS